MYETSACPSRLMRSQLIPSAVSVSETDGTIRVAAIEEPYAEARPEAVEGLLDEIVAGVQSPGTIHWASRIAESLQERLNAGTSGGPRYLVYAGVTANSESIEVATVGDIR